MKEFIARLKCLLLGHWWEWRREGNFWALFECERCNAIKIILAKTN